MKEGETKSNETDEDKDWARNGVRHSGEAANGAEFFDWRRPWSGRHPRRRRREDRHQKVARLQAGEPECGRKTDAATAGSGNAQIPGQGGLRHSCLVS